MSGVLKSIGSAISGVAPVLANALIPGVGGVVANAAISAVAKGLGLDEKATAEVVNRTLQGPLSGEQLAGLRKEAMQFEERMKELDIDLARVHADDRASARRMQIKTRAVIVPSIAAVVLTGWLLLNGYVAYAVLTGIDINLTGESGILLGQLVGGVGAVATTITSFYFGSSKSETERKEVSNA